MVKKIVWVGLLIPSLVFAGEERIKLKEGPGKNLVAGVCTFCHSLDYIIMNSPFMDKKGWEASVNKMVKAMGAPMIKESDISQIVDYLARYYGTGKNDAEPLTVNAHKPIP